jgi:hypothetical protein
VVSLTKLALRNLARRSIELGEEIKGYDAILEPLVTETAPELLDRLGVGPDSAGALLVAAGDNPERLRSEAAFAHLCGAAPSTPRVANSNVTGSTVAETARRAQRSGTSSSPGCLMTRAPRPTSNGG